PVHASLLLGCATMGTAFVPAAHWVGQGGSGRRRLALAGRRVELVCCWNRVPERPPVRDKGAKLPSAMSPHRAASEGRVAIPAKAVSPNSTLAKLTDDPLATAMARATRGHGRASSEPR